MSDISPLLNIHNVPLWVTNRLAKYSFGVVVKKVVGVCNIIRIYHANLDALPWKTVCKQIVSATV